jgi:hypothetical protein
MKFFKIFYKCIIKYYTDLYNKRKFWYNIFRIEYYTDLYNKRKFWYNIFGIYIENIYEKLMKLHRIRNYIEL